MRIYLRHGRSSARRILLWCRPFDNINHCGVLQIKHYILCVPHPFLVAGTTYCSMFLLKRKGISCKFLFSEYCILLFRADRNLHFSNSFCKRSFKNGLGRAGQKDLIFRPVPCNEKPAAAQFYGSFSLRKHNRKASPRRLPHTLPFRRTAFHRSHVPRLSFLLCVDLKSG